MLLFVLIYNNL
uniref:Uncharacterized protein n=1 Tax=Anguilla anguilla TaxID=7936 RepID=A0A0E9UEN4_ANGAN